MKGSERVKQCIVIRSKMNELGISNLDSIKTYNDIMNNYIRTGECKSGVVLVPEINRQLFYDFNNKECTVTLKMNNGS
jgi:hypothetical protein